MNRKANIAAVNYTAATHFHEKFWNRLIQFKHICSNYCVQVI